MRTYELGIAACCSAAAASEFIPAADRCGQKCFSLFFAATEFIFICEREVAAAAAVLTLVVQSEWSDVRPKKTKHARNIVLNGSS